MVHPLRARARLSGTDILIELERGIRTASVLIDITRIPGLDQIDFSANTFHLDPLVTHNQVISSRELV